MLWLGQRKELAVGEGQGAPSGPWGNPVPRSPSAEHLRAHAKSFGNHQPHCERATAGHPGNAGGDCLLTPSDRSTVPTPKEGKLHRKAGTELRFATGAKKKKKFKKIYLKKKEENRYALKKINIYIIYILCQNQARGALDLTCVVLSCGGVVFKM